MSTRFKISVGWVNLWKGRQVKSLYICVCLCVSHTITLIDQVGLGEAEEFDITNDAWKKLANSKSKATTTPSSSEIDHFMVLQSSKTFYFCPHNDL